ncbi:MAG: glutaredoxin family protein [Actinomycetota bacterium]
MREKSLQFVTSPGCHLCEEAEPVVRRAAGRFGIEVETVDIGSDDDLVRLYAWRVPVVLGPDGDVLAEGMIRERPLRSALRRMRRAGRA